MTTDFYSHGGYPATGAAGTSAAMRSELDLVEAGFAKLAALTGNGSKFLRVNSGATAYEALDVPSAVTALFANVISPTQITSNQNDYNPTSLSTATAVRISTDASRDITGMQGGTAGRMILLANAGSFNAVLKAESGSSSAANRFALSYDLTLLPGWVVLLWYDGTSSRWRVQGLQASAFIQTLLDDTTAAAACTTLGAISGTIVDAKGDLIVGTAADTPARKAVGSNGQILVADSTQSDGLIWTDFSKDPLNVNPNMLLDQIYEGATTSTAGSVGGTTTQFADGWSLYCLNPSGAGAGTVRVSRVTDPDFASRSALKIECTTADTTVSTGDRYEIYTTLEGYDLVSLGPGLASAGSITLQFQFKSNKTGTYCVSFRNSAASRSYVGTITVSDTSVHDYSVTLTLDTSGTWLYTNGVGCYITFALMTGSTYHTTAGAWQTGNYLATSAQVNFMDANTNVAYLGRFHVIPGNVVCAYKPADIECELRKAQRYYEKSYDQGQAVGNTGGSRFNGSRRIYQNFATAATGYTGLAHIDYRVTKRTLPTVTSYSPQNGTGGVIYDNSSGTDVGANLANGGDSGFNNNGTSPATTTIIDLFFHWSSNARLS